MPDQGPVFFRHYEKTMSAHICVGLRFISNNLSCRYIYSNFQASLVPQMDYLASAFLGTPFFLLGGYFLSIWILRNPKCGYKIPTLTTLVNVISMQPVGTIIKYLQNWVVIQ